MYRLRRNLQTIAITLFASAVVLSGRAQFARTVDELLERSDEKFLNEVLFFSTTVSNGTPRADLWRVMDRLQRLRLPDNQQISHATQMGYLAQAISRYGTPEDFARLLALTDATP